MILIITGNGKGKTTSALGTALRASGWGKKTGIVFFDKGGAHYGEQNNLDFLQEKIETHRFGLLRFDEKERTFRFENTEEDRLEAARAADKVIAMCGEGFFLIICDEVINCLNLGLLERAKLEEVLDACPTEGHLVLTGRNVPDWLAEKADLISEVSEVKHYFRKGKDAVKGLDF